MQPIFDRPSAANASGAARPYDGRILASMEDDRPQRGGGARWAIAGAGATAVLVIAIAVLARMQVAPPASARAPAAPVSSQPADPQAPFAAPPAEIALPEAPAPATQLAQETPAAQPVPARISRRPAETVAAAERPAVRKRKAAAPVQRPADGAPAEASDHDVALLAAIIAYGRSAAARPARP